MLYNLVSENQPMDWSHYGVTRLTALNLSKSESFNFHLIIACFCTIPSLKTIFSENCSQALVITS